MGTQGKLALSFSSIRIPTFAKIVLSVQEAPTVLYIAFSQNDMIKKSQYLVLENSMSIRGYTHMKIKIYIAFDERDFTICQDTRTSRALISRIFLTNFFDIDIIKVFKPVRIAGYLNPIIKLQEWAI